ncbi:MAG: M28 family metallopeptidase [Gemmatimonadales bacterium]
MTSFNLRRGVALGATAMAILAPALMAQRRCPAIESGATMPLKYHGGSTVAAITPCDLMTRLYIYSDDSMMGRRVGTVDNLRATAYIAAQVKRMGLKPAGDSGSYFQYLPVFERHTDSSSAIAVGGRNYLIGHDFTGNLTESTSLADVPTVYGGVANDTDNVLSPDAVKGKVLILSAAAGGGAFWRGGRRGAVSPAMQAYRDMEQAAAEVLTIRGENGSGRGGRGGRGGGFGGGRGMRGGPTGVFEDPAQPSSGRGFGGGGVTIDSSLGDAIFGQPVDGLAKGTAGKPVSIEFKVTQTPLPTRNVVAIVPGSDPGLRGEYVAIGAHNDHNGYTIGGGIDHDSLKAYNEVALVEGADTRPRPTPTAAQWIRINAIKDSLRRVYPERLDSIQNGADDDGSGTVSALEIAEAFAKGSAKPKRSIIFVWHTGEEAGLWGSQWFTNHPTVPRDSIVAQLNMDMVGRGAATDVTGRSIDSTLLHGEPNYVQLVGSRRLSTELGDIAEQVDKTEKVPLDFDYSMDANGHPQNIYCRSDHANYARYGIPVIFFTTGGHADYHQNTDEAQYIQYQHMARVDQLVFDIAMKVADLGHRVVVDKPKPESPFARCQQ